MRKNIVKRSLPLIVAMILLAGCSFDNKPSIYEQDAKYLVETMENTHPCFVLDDIPEGYKEAKAAYLKAAKVVKNQEEFYEICLKYCCSLKDGHIFLDESEVLGDYVLKVEWYSDGKALYLCDENGKPTERKVQKIGGVDVQDVFRTIEEYCTMENESAVNLMYRSRSRLVYYLERAGVKCDFDSKLILSLDDGSDRKVEWVKRKDSNEGAEETENLSWKMIGDVFYIDQDQCDVEDPNLEEVCEALNEAVAKGTVKVIYDVRGNPGGNSAACGQILQAMQMTPPSFGMVVRVSELAKQTYPEYYEDYSVSQVEEFDGNASDAVANPDVDLIVLSDEWTYSSANMLCVWVQDGKLGRVVGQGSSNSPSAYGDILPFKLPNTELSGYVSCRRWTRPDAEADQKQLRPDVEVPYGEDSLQVALELLR
ncbi:S41 family peptidase [Roseburia hominis]